MNETDVKKGFKRKFDAEGIFWWSLPASRAGQDKHGNWFGSSKGGLPDTEACINSKHVALEYKYDKFPEPKKLINKMRKLQRGHAWNLKEAKGKYYVLARGGDIYFVFRHSENLSSTQELKFECATYYSYGEATTGMLNSVIRGVFPFTRTFIIARHSGR